MLPAYSGVGSEAKGISQRRASERNDNNDERATERNQVQGSLSVHTLHRDTASRHDYIASYVAKTLLGAGNAASVMIGSFPLWTIVWYNS